GSVLTTALFVQSLFAKAEASSGFIGAISAWLWFTVLFANFAEGIAEGRGKAQADTLRNARRDIQAVRLDAPSRGAKQEEVAASALRKGDVVLVEAGSYIP